MPLSIEKDVVKKTMKSVLLPAAVTTKLTSLPLVSFGFILITYAIQTTFHDATWATIIGIIFSVVFCVDLNASLRNAGFFVDNLGAVRVFEFVRVGDHVASILNE